MKTSDIFSSIVVLVIVLAMILAATGWIMNFVKFVRLDFKEPYKAEIIRGVGLTSYGIIIGWLDIDDN
ncbi:MAG: hypothetical protein WC346_06810 [Methanogenium sp.]|jgi:hypothetical protein